MYNLHKCIYLHIYVYYNFHQTKSISVKYFIYHLKSFYFVMIKYSWNHTKSRKEKVKASREWSLRHNRMQIVSTFLRQKNIVSREVRKFPKVTKLILMTELRFYILINLVHKSCSYLYETGSFFTLFSKLHQLTSGAIGNESSQESSLQAYRWSLCWARQAE